LFGEGGVVEDYCGDVGWDWDAETAVGDYGWEEGFACSREGDVDGEVCGVGADGGKDGESCAVGVEGGFEVVRWTGEGAEFVALEELGELLSAAGPLRFGTDGLATDGCERVGELGVVAEVDVLW